MLIYVCIYFLFQGLKYMCVSHYLQNVPSLRPTIQFKGLQGVSPTRKTKNLVVF